jgi:FkbM family methyltransferase
MKLTFVDIGSVGGFDPRWNRPEIEKIGFDPLDPNSIQEVLWRTEDTRQFYVTQNGFGSSLLLPDEAFNRRFYPTEKHHIAETRTVKTTTLDHVFNGKDIDFLKLDCQGAELPILDGGIETLTKVVGLKVEVEFRPMYQRQFLFGEVDAFLTGQGFDLIDFLRLNHLPVASSKNHSGGKHLIWADAFYLRRIINDEDKLFAAILAASIYGYRGIGRELLLSNKLQLYSKEKKYVDQLLAEPKPRPVRKWLAKQLYKAHLHFKND